jgi:hypothetical protein
MKKFVALGITIKNVPLFILEEDKDKKEAIINNLLPKKTPLPKDFKSVLSIFGGFKS